MNLLEKIAKSKKINQLKKQITRKKSIIIESANETAKFLIALSLLANFSKILWITKDNSKALQIFQILKNLNPKSVLNFIPIIDEKDRSAQITRKEIIAQILLAKKQLIVAPIASIFEKIKSDRKRFLKVKIDHEFSFSYLAKKLQDLGYERVDRVILAGDFSIRGGIFDIFPVTQKNPVRLEFGGQRLERIFEFNLLTGEKITDKNKLEVIPILEKKLTKSLIDIIDQKSLILLDESVDLAENLISLNLMNPQIPTWKKLERKLKNFQKIYFESLADFGPKLFRFNLGWGQPNLYYGNFTKIKKDFDSQKIILLNQPTTNLKNLGNVEFLKISLPQGLIIPQINLVILTPREIFGPSKLAEIQRKITKEKKEFLESLTPGDLVVHTDHGIGVFRKVAPLEFKTKQGKIKGDYIFLEYAAEDKIYLPLTQISKISRYVGPAGLPPVLSRLGTGAWLRIKKKVTENAEKFARELLEIAAIREKFKGFQYFADEEWERQLESTFEYLKTPDQKKAIERVYQDMENDRCMDRLICGDTGFGKTEVAIRAALRAVSSAKQVAVICPTTILAEQHLVTFAKRLKTFPIRIERLSRFASHSEQKKLIWDLGTGKIDIIIGTHRLLSRDINFADLGLVIIDEEQRFGVAAKEKLKRLRAWTDILTLTATPIPRTLFMSLAGIRDISMIETPPEGRQPIETKINQFDNNLIRQAILDEIKRGGQVYFVHNRVLGILRVLEQLREILPKSVKIAVAHGQMDEKLLAQTMAEFTEGKYDVLLSTTIIENGLDLPNVNTLVVNRAEKFGLADLYQLRGRIGRGDRQAYAYFLIGSSKITPMARKRLSAVLEAKDLGSGYQIAMRDLEIRGGGNVLGREQHGNMAAVGLTLYSQLLAEAVEKVKSVED